MLSVKRQIDDCVGGIASCRTVEMTLSFGCSLVLVPSSVKVRNWWPHDVVVGFD